MTDADAILESLNMRLGSANPLYVRFAHHFADERGIIRPDAARKLFDDPQRHVWTDLRTALLHLGCEEIP